MPRGNVLQDFKIQNIVGSCDVKFPIRLEGLAYSHGYFCSVSIPSRKLAKDDKEVESLDRTLTKLACPSHSHETSLPQSPSPESWFVDAAYCSCTTKSRLVTSTVCLWPLPMLVMLALLPDQTLLLSGNSLRRKCGKAMMMLPHKEILKLRGLASFVLRMKSRRSPLWHFFAPPQFCVPKWTQ